MSAGWARRQIGIDADGLAMCGYGMWNHQAHGVSTPLWARAVHIAERGGTDDGCDVVCLDMAMVNHSIRSGVEAELQARLGASFRPEALILTCTHSHSTPGGCGYEAMYNFVTPGFAPGHLHAVIDAAAGAVVDARAEARPVDISIGSGDFPKHRHVAWNRSIRSYNRNPDVAPVPEDRPEEAVDRSMTAMRLRAADGSSALVSVFGVHATCLGNDLDLLDGDNKGYASAYVERLWGDQLTPPVAIFAQGGAGDVSPHYHGPGQWARRRSIRGRDQYRYAKANGEMQAHQALAVTDKAAVAVGGEIRAVFAYADLADVTVDPKFADGRIDARTADPCHGVDFFLGTPVDGRGMPALAGRLARFGSRLARRIHLRSKNQQTRAYYERLYAAHDPKDILLESSTKKLLGRPLREVRLPDRLDPSVAEMKRQARIGAIDDSLLVPHVLPLQIVRIGDLALVAAPGEFTTVASARLRATVAEAMGPGVEVVVITYANDYMGYVTTREEYQNQAYEGGHTIFGQWTLAAFQTLFAGLATSLATSQAAASLDRELRPEAPVLAELSLRTNAASTRP